MLFMTVLSTELRALKRRGYNGEPRFSVLKSHWKSLEPTVDRILNQQRAAQENRLQEPTVQRAPLQETPTQIKRDEIAHTTPTLPAVTSPSTATSSDGPNVLSRFRQKMKEFNAPSLPGSSPLSGPTTQTHITQKSITPTQNIGISCIATLTAPVS